MKVDGNYLIQNVSGSMLHVCIYIYYMSVDIVQYIDHNTIDHNTIDHRVDML